MCSSDLPNIGLGVKRQLIPTLMTKTERRWLIGQDVYKAMPSLDQAVNFRSKVLHHACMCSVCNVNKVVNTAVINASPGKSTSQNSTIEA